MQIIITSTVPGKRWKKGEIVTVTNDYGAELIKAKKAKSTLLTLEPEKNEDGETLTK